jgi:hypothetical protein
VRRCGSRITPSFGEIWYASNLFGNELQPWTVVEKTYCEDAKDIQGFQGQGNGYFGISGQGLQIEGVVA